MASLTKYTIEIYAKTSYDAAVILNEVREVIAAGCSSSGGWTGVSRDQRYQFDTEPISNAHAPQPAKDGGA